MKKNSLMEFDSLDDLFKYWEYYASQYNPLLLEPIKVERINFHYNQNGIAIRGYDWILNSRYDARIKQVTSDPLNFMLFGDSLNKGTLRTIELLDSAKSNNKEYAAIWLAAFIAEISEYLPDNWRGEQYRMISKMELIINIEIRKKYIFWHHAMKKLLPEICFSGLLLDSIAFEHYSNFIELAVLNASHILNSYRAVYYDSDFKSK